MPAHADLESTLLGYPAPPRPTWRPSFASVLLAATGLILLFTFFSINSNQIQIEPKSNHTADRVNRVGSTDGPERVQSEVGAVAADDGRCSVIGAAALDAGGHAVDAAVAAALCLGVVHPMSSGLGGGAFIVVRESESGESLAIDARETAPMAAAKDMYKNNPVLKYQGALSAGVPGELAGLHATWRRFGRLPWRDLFLPSIKLAREGFTIVPYVAEAMKTKEQLILADPGLREVLAPGGRLLLANETCYNPKLADTLEEIAENGPEVFYNGTIGEKFVNDIKNAGGVITMEDMRGYKVEVTKAMEASVMGYKLLGMPPPSSGTVGMALVMNILESYKSIDEINGLLGLHRLVESLKHMYALRMNLGDPDFVNVTGVIANMLSPSFAAEIQKKIVDNTTFGPDYYMPKWSQITDHGTSHLCVVDSDRNAVSLTSTVNYYFGSGVLSPSTGIVLNNEMDDFSVPSDVTPDQLPPSPANFIQPNKRPLSSMTPLIILKDNQLAGVVGGSGGTKIIPAVIQVFLNHFIFGMDPLGSVQQARVYPQLAPNKVQYENYTAIDGELIYFDNKAKLFLEERGHILQNTTAGAVCQLIVHNLNEPVSNLNSGVRVFHGMLTAVSDPRKDGSPAGL